MTNTKALPTMVLTIACCGLLSAQVPTQPPKPKTPPAPAASGPPDPCGQTTLTSHDAPIIISDGSISVTFDTTYFADLTLPAWSNLLDVNKQLTGALLSHTHASCPSVPMPRKVRGNSGQTPGQCTSTCGSVACPHHYLLVATPKLGIARPTPLQDCDSLLIFLDQKDAGTGQWVRASTKVFVMMQYVAQFNHGLPGTPAKFIAQSNKMRQRAVPPNVSQQQAWVVLPWDGTEKTPALWRTSAGSGPTKPKYESTANYRLNRVEIWSHTQGQSLSPNLGHSNRQIQLANGQDNGCSVLQITADSTFDPNSSDPAPSMALPCAGGGTRTAPPPAK